jgi:hypothetical protein
MLAKRSGGVGHDEARFFIQLRTGFFKREPYLVTVSRAALVFTPAGEKGEQRTFAVPCAAVLAAAIFGRARPELEIRTADQVIAGTFAHPADAARAANALRAALGSRLAADAIT